MLCASGFTNNLMFLCRCARQRAYLNNYTPKLHQVLSACSPWLGPPLARRCDMLCASGFTNNLMFLCCCARQRAYLNNYTPKLHQVLSACSPWLGPGSSGAAMRCDTLCASGFTNDLVLRGSVTAWLAGSLRAPPASTSCNAAVHLSTTSVCCEDTPVTGSAVRTSQMK